MTTALNGLWGYYLYETSPADQPTSEIQMSCCERQILMTETRRNDLIKAWRKETSTVTRLPWLSMAETVIPGG